MSVKSINNDLQNSLVNLNDKPKLERTEKHVVRQDSPSVPFSIIEQLHKQMTVDKTSVYPSSPSSADERHFVYLDQNSDSDDVKKFLVQNSPKQEKDIKPKFDLMDIELI